MRIFVSNFWFNFFWFQVSPENESWTIFEQQASMEVKSFWGFEHMVEKLAVKHYSQNVKKGEEIIEYYINELAEEGITHIEPFEGHDTLVNNTNHNHSDNNQEHDDSAISNQLNKAPNGTKLSRSRSAEQSHCKNKNGHICKEDMQKSAKDKSGCCFKTKTECKDSNGTKCDSTRKKSSGESNNNGIKEGITNSLSLC